MKIFTFIDFASKKLEELIYRKTNNMQLIVNDSNAYEDSANLTYSEYKRI